MNLPKESKNLNRMDNRFLSSSTSESEDLKDERFNLRKKKINITPKEEGSKNNRPCSKKSSNERSLQSSNDGKKTFKAHNPKFLEGLNHTNCREEQTRHEIRSRESSLSSRASSKQSKISHFSNRGSGDHRMVKTSQTPRNNIDEREDLKFSMSDLESRIHALQKLLSEGLNF